MGLATQLDFTLLARALQEECRRLGLEVSPAFRSPPRLGVDRSIHRYPEATVVLVRLGRDQHDVAADMIAGVIAANGLDADAAALVSGPLWIAAGEASVTALASLTGREP